VVCLVGLGLVGWFRIGWFMDVGSIEAIFTCGDRGSHATARRELAGTTQEPRQ
jgi:hypothetical protein